LSPEGIEVDLVVAPDLEVLQATAAGQEVVGEVQDVVALVVRQVPLQEVEALVEVVDQADPSGQEVDRPDAAGGDRPSAVGQLVVDVGGGRHRLGSFDGPVLQSAKDSPLASVQPAMDTGVHSKTSWWRIDEAGQVPRLFARTRGFSRFPTATAMGLRLVED
jgi:hypothetical protein